MITLYFTFLPGFIYVIIVCVNFNFNVLNEREMSSFRLVGCLVYKRTIPPFLVQNHRQGGLFLLSLYVARHKLIFVKSFGFKTTGNVDFYYCHYLSQLVHGWIARMKTISPLSDAQTHCVSNQQYLICCLNLPYVASTCLILSKLAQCCLNLPYLVKTCLMMLKLAQCCLNWE